MKWDGAQLHLAADTGIPGPIFMWQDQQRKQMEGAGDRGATAIDLHFPVGQREVAKIVGKFLSISKIVLGVTRITWFAVKPED